MTKIVDKFPRQIEVREKDLWIPMSDGVSLAGRMWIPQDAAERPVPAILEFLPYRKGDLMRPSDETYHPYFAGNGYASIRVDLRGAGDSFGVMRDEYEIQEQDDAVEVIAWLAKQSWCNGAVGMMGISWSGFNSLQVAARRPPALRAIITACSTDDRYADDMHYMGGVLLNDNLDWGTTFLSRLPLPPDPEIMGKEWRRNWAERIAAIEPPAATWMRHQTRDKYWQHGSICEDYRSIQCPVMAVGGWLDGYSNAVFRLLKNLAVPTVGIVGVHAHQFGFDGRAPGPAYGFLQEAVRWWDHWLKKVPNDVERIPKLRAYIAEDVPSKPLYEKCPGRWVAEAEWPSPQIAMRKWYLTPTKLTLNTNVPSCGISHKSPLTIGLAGGEWCPYGTGGIGPEFPDDQRFDDAASLSLDSEPLTEPIEILGAPVVTLDLSVDKQSAFVVVRLNDVKPDGSSTRTSFGVLNLANRNGFAASEPVVPNKTYRVRIQLNDVGYRFIRGHRIRLSISTSYWPMIWPSPEQVALQLFTGSSALDLPVRTVTTEVGRSEPLGPPEMARPMRMKQLEPVPCRNYMVRDLVNKTTEVVAERGSGFYRIEENQIEAGLNVVEKFSISEDQPQTARTEVVSHARTGREGQLIDVTATSVLTGTLSEFKLISSLEIRENGSVTYSKTWTDQLPRGTL